MEGFRMKYLKIAEMMDVFRVIPRVLVAGYCYLLYRVVDWYMNLEPYIPKEVQPHLRELIAGGASVTELMVMAPTTQHAALVSTVVGIAAAVFGLYTSTGIKWAEFKFREWKKGSTGETSSG